MNQLTQTSFLSIVLIFASANATESSQTTAILQLIEQINQVDFPSNMKCEGACFFGFFKSSGKSDKLLQQCAMDICGPPNKNPIFLLSNTSFSEPSDPAVLAQFDNQVAPALRTNLDRRREYYKKAFSDLENLKASLNKDPTNPEWSASTYFIMMKYTVFTTSKRGTPIKEAYKSKNQALVDPQKQAFIESYLQRENTFREKTADEVRTQPLDQLKEQVRNEIEARLKHLENQNSYNPETMEVRFLEMAKKVIESPNRTNIEKMAINLASQAHMQSTSCQDEVCRQIIRKELDLLRQSIEKDAELTKKKYDEIYINECKSNFIEKAEAMKYTQTFKNNLPKYKQQIIKTGLAPYSEKSRQQFGSYINNTLQIDIPNNVDTIQAFRDYIPVSSPNSETGQTVSFVDLQRAVSNPIYKNLCPSSQLKFLTDVFNRDQHKIEMSFASCAFHDHGKGTLAHEIGHAISLLFHPENTTKMSEFSTKKYHQLRTCASKQYKDKTLNPEMPQKGFFAHQNDKLKTEENTADLFSYMVFQDDPTHHQCTLLQTSTNGQNYKSLDVLQSPQMMSPHSTPFFRVLMEAIHKRTNLSSACRRVINKYKNKINFKPCF